MDSKRILITGISHYWGGRLAQALESFPEIEAVIGVDNEEPQVELERTEYVKVGAQGDTPRGILASGADVKSTSFTGLIGGGYSVLDRSEHSLDVVAGLRVWSVDTDITFKGRLADGRKHSESATWVDAMVGVRGTYNFHPKAYLTGWGMIGAGGAQADWDVGVGIGYNFSKMISGTIGYRAMGVDYDRNGFKYDAVLQGPIAGLTIRF